MPDDSKERIQDGLLGVIKQRRELLILVRKLRRIAGQCSLPPEVIALAPTEWQAISSPITNLSKIAQAFATKVDQEKTDFESHFRDNRKRTVARAMEIAYSIDPDNEAVAFQFAVICLKAHRTTLAYNILDHLAENSDSSSKYVSSAKRRVARQAWNAGDGDRAVMLMRSVRGRAAREQCRTWLAMLTIRNGLLIADGGNPAGAREVLKGALTATGMDQDMADAVTAIYLLACSRTPQSEDMQAVPQRARLPNSNGAPRAVILSGFGWSGSGAVADYLKGHTTVMDAFSGRELGLWSGKFGLDRLYGHFATKGFNRRLLLEFLTRHCFGHMFLGSSKGTKSAGGMWAWLDENQRWELLGALSRWISSIHQWTAQSNVPILDSFKSLSTEFLHLLSDPESDYVLLSNCIPSNCITGVRMFRNPVVIVSWRNPSDAYISKKAAFPDLSVGVDGWQDQLKTRIGQYLAGKAEVIQQVDIWLDICFEEFVTDTATRHQLLDHLALDSKLTRSTFDPEVSAQNIGIAEPETDTDNANWRELVAHVATAKQKAADLSGRDESDSTYAKSGNS